MWNKIKRIYVGTQKVRPIETWTYSMDFRTVSASDLRSAGWTLASGVTLNSTRWMYASGWAVNYYTPSGLWDAMQTAKKVTITMLSNQTTASASQWDYRLVLQKISGSGGDIWFYWNYNMIRVYIAGTSTQYSKYATSTSDYTVNQVYDLVNKTVVSESTWIGLSSTLTLTDADITEIRWLWKIDLTLSWQRNIKTISVTVEY
jgi:hypothetical protein